MTEKPKQPHRWEPGQSGNLGGRPKGSKTQIGKEVEDAYRKLMAGKLSAEQMIASSARRIVALSLSLALDSGDFQIMKKFLPPLLDRVSPTLRVIDVRQEFRRPHELTNKELLCLGMELQRGKQVPGRGNGGEPILIEGPSPGEPGDNQNTGGK